MIEISTRNLFKSSQSIEYLLWRRYPISSSIPIKAENSRSNSKINKIWCFQVHLRMKGRFHIDAFWDCDLSVRLIFRKRRFQRYFGRYINSLHIHEIKPTSLAQGGNFDHILERRRKQKGYPHKYFFRAWIFLYYIFDNEKYISPWIICSSRSLCAKRWLFALHVLSFV